MMILDTFSLPHTWLIPHLIAKNSASVLVTNTAWWTVLVKGWSCICTCDIDVAMSFLILASVTTMAVCGEDDDYKVILSSCWMHILLFFFLLAKLKENWSKNMSTILEPGLNSGWRKENEGKTP